MKGLVKLQKPRLLNTKRPKTRCGFPPQEVRRRAPLQQPSLQDQKPGKGRAKSGLFLVASLKNCAKKKDLCWGFRLHAEIRTSGLLAKNAHLGSALISMYAKCSALSRAQDVFHEVAIRDVCTWNTLLAGYAQQGLGKELLDCFCQMRIEGLLPDAFTYACTLKACGITKDVDLGEQIHDELVSQGLLEKDAVLGNALVDMYAKCGVLTKAREVLDGLLSRNVVTWSALIAGYVQEGHGKEALVCYDHMRHEDLSPDAITYACILKACGIAKEADKGKQIHEEIVKQGLLVRDPVLGNALVNMYAKCGLLSKAKQAFDELPVRDVFSWSELMAGYAQEGRSEEAKECFEKMQSEGLVPNTVSWTTLIGGYAHQGKSKEALHCFHRMQREGISPDAATLVCVLNACSHSGLVHEGQMLFEDLEEKFGISPELEHHVCMIDLFGRAGHFDKAMAVIENLSSCNHHTIWSALLGACRRWGNVKLGRLAFERAVQINRRDVASYVCMENIYAAAGMREEAWEIESMREKMLLEAAMAELSG